MPRRNTPFVPEAPRCFLPVGETGVCKRKGGSQGPETQRNCRLRKFRLSFWVEAPWSALRGWPLSNQTNNAARPSSRASEDLVSCLRTGSLRAGQWFVARRRDTWSALDPASEGQTIDKPEVGRRDRIQPEAPPRGADQGSLGRADDPMAILMEARQNRGQAIQARDLGCRRGAGGIRIGRCTRP